MIKRTKEQRSIELLQGLMKQDYAVDSANLDILEDLIEQAKKDEDSKLADYDPIMYALNLAVRVTLEDGLDPQLVIPLAAIALIEIDTHTMNNLKFKI